MRKINIAILVSSICITLFLVFTSIDKNIDGWTQRTIGFGLWTISPYIFLLVITTRPRWQTKELKILLTCTIIICIFGVGIFIDGFFIHLDAQNALLLIFIPFWQWLGGSLAYIGGYIIYGLLQMVRSSR